MKLGDVINTPLQWRLFLDDECFPPDDGHVWTIARSYDEAVRLIEEKGMPIFISFDHDLGDLDKTGYRLVKWIVNKDIRSKKRLFQRDFRLTYIHKILSVLTTFVN